MERTAEQGDGLWATLRHATPAGAVVGLELEGAEGTLLEVEVPRERYAAIDPRLGDRLHLRPRSVCVFVDERGGPAPRR